MNELDELQTLVRLLDKFKLPVSPILEYAIKEKEEALCAEYPMVVNGDSGCSENAAPSFESAPISIISIKNEYSIYLYKTKAERTARNYLCHIEVPIRKYINRIVDSEADSVYCCRTVSEIRALLLKLKSDDLFVADNQKRHNAMTAAINSYMEFLESKE